MRIGVFCRRQDVTARELAQELNVLEPGCCVPFHHDAIGDNTITRGDNTIRWNGVELTTLESAWICGFPYMDPVVPPVAGRPDWARWQCAHLLEQQTYSALESVFAELERQGVQLVNRRAHALGEFSKAEQLLRLGRNGCTVPQLLCSNDEEQADAFCARFENVLWRPPTGRAAWQRFTGKQRRHLIGPDKPPVVLAERLGENFNIAWCFDGDAMLCVELDPPAPRPVEVLGNPADYGELLRFETLEMLTVRDPHDASFELGSAWRGSPGLRWAAVTSMRDKAGRTVIYDIDPDPDISWLPEPLRDWLKQCVARRLLDREPDRRYAPAVGMRLQRPALFLRRMLQIQYEMEDSKYPSGDE